MDRTHRVALIGAGRIAGVHLGFARGIRNARIVAVCDLDRARVDEFAKQKNIPAAFTDVAEMMRETEPSIVHVVTPPATHAKLAIAAMERGANVLVEKPMAMTVDECDAMTAAARMHGRRLCVDHNRLFDPVVRQATALFERGVIGDVVGAEAHQGVNLVEDAAPGNGQTHWSVENAFAPLYNLGPHPIYLIGAFLGGFHSVQVSASHGGPEGALMREIRVMLEGQRGLGYVSFSMGAQPYLNHLTVYGTKATLRANLNTMALVVERNRKLPKLVNKLAANLDPALQLTTATVRTAIAVATRRMKLYPGIGETIRRFYRSLDEGTRPPVDPADGREVVRVLRIIEASLSPHQLPTAANGSLGGNGEVSAWTS